MSISSSYTATSSGGRSAINRWSPRKRLFFARFDQGQFTVGLGRPRRGSDPLEGLAHRRRVNLYAGLLAEGGHEHLPSPGRTPPTVLLRRRSHDFVEHSQIPLIQLSLPILFPVIHQPGFPLFPESSGDFVNRRSSHATNPCCFRRPSTIEQIQNDQVANPFSLLRTSTQARFQPLLGAANAPEAQCLPWDFPPWDGTDVSKTTIPR